VCIISANKANPHTDIIFQTLLHLYVLALFVCYVLQKKGASSPSQLRREEEIYASLKGMKGVPKVRDAFENSKGEYVMVMDLLGPSLEDAFCKCSRRFSLQTVLQLGYQMLERLEMLHSNHIIHRDIKTDNFVIGAFSGEKRHIVYMIDFGLSKLYRDPKTRLHRFGSHGFNKFAVKTGTGVGSPYFSSIRAHSDEETSRRDDLESLAYVIIYLLVGGKLPWDEANKKKQFDEVLQIKKSTTIEQLCVNVPPQIAKLLEYVQKLDFVQEPDYAFCKGLMTSAASENGLASIIAEEGSDLSWDWDAHASSSSSSPLQEEC